MNDSYRNPFSGVNAVQLGTDSILKYWCSPFAYDLFSEIKEADIYEDEMNIVLMGGRSTGKSMFLRYWSFPVQFKRAEKDNIGLIDMIRVNNGIGFYFRIDGPTLRSFQGYGLDDEHWSSIFTHYFELTVGRQYVEAIRRLQNDPLINAEIVENGFIARLCELLEFNGTHTLDEAILEIDRRIQIVDRFRGNVAFYQERFNPGGPAFSSETLSFGIAELIIKCISSFEKLNIIILLDEYENFLTYQQKVVNTLLRFTKPQIKFRVGMRLEGFRTFKMIGEEDFIKEGREYRKVVFEDISNRDNDYPKFLAEVARKRLDSVDKLREKGFTNIKAFLTSRENLEAEAKDLVRNDPDRVYKHFLRGSGIAKTDLEKIRYQQNPLLEMLNIIWLTRGVTSDETLQSMREFLDAKKTEKAKKYRRDYIDKYKLSLMFLLCSIYKKEKQYYSFNTFAFLSSGIVGHFIELCRRTFAIAEWGDNDALLNKGVISREDQTRAAVDFSIAEKQQINRIEECGGKISRFVDNIGNIFRSFHSDPRMRYPEVNQFALNIDTIQG